MRTTPTSAFLLLMAALCSGAVVDRVAVVIDKKVFTESEVLDELRVTEFINNQPLDLNPAARRAAAEHLVDQELIRRDLQNSGYPQPSPSEADALVRKFRQERFHSVAEFRAALQKYGISEEQLKKRLLWQLTVLRFTDLRFRPLQPDSNSQSADRAASDGAATSVDQQLDAWLKQTRADSKIVFKPEAFQ